MLFEPAVFMIITAWPLLSKGTFVPATVRLKLATPTLSLPKTRNVTFVPVFTVVPGVICNSTVGATVSLLTVRPNVCVTEMPYESVTCTVMLLNTLPMSTVCGVQVMRPFWSMVMTLLLGPV